jgi:hypothetical protein
MNCLGKKYLKKNIFLTDWEKWDKPIEEGSESGRLDFL